ncbi:MAG: deoxyguanosinetriphosphate triphosphohydrolase [Verrucomicrobiales bacterium]|nr:deoxyguanosinetriphosphate triphosphohydrolase [Verrucomicrobiales bacterium]
MLRTRKDLEAAEGAVLNPYAQRVADSLGRAVAEPEHRLRTAYQRDRARVIHSSAFRRLEYKTQVFLNGTGDHLRTRLTHTMEVASISRVMARALGLNEDLAETIALAHDLGHSPFGHTGEKRLNDLMAEAGGFDHNKQSLRVVEFLESKYPGMPGLNLSFEVREGLRKHEHHFVRKDGDTEIAYFSASLEAQIADVADEIAYYSHDLDDGLDHGLLKEADLENIDLWNRCAKKVKSEHPGFEGSSFRRQVIRNLIDLEVENVVEATLKRIEAAGVQCAHDVRDCEKALAGYSDDFRVANAQLRKYLYQNLYYHPIVAGPNSQGGEMIEKVFHFLIKNPDRMGNTSIARIESEGLQRSVCDYISGMTDRFLFMEAEKL